MIFNIITCYPELYPGPLSHGVIGRSYNQAFSLNITDIRDNNRFIDDRPFGGGAGMVVRPDALSECIDNHIHYNNIEYQNSNTSNLMNSGDTNNTPNNTPNNIPNNTNGNCDGNDNSHKNATEIIVFSPRGEQLTQDMVNHYSKYEQLTLVCGSFAGIDHRVIQHYRMRELSIGDYILPNGDFAAFIFISSVVRLLGGVLGNSLSLKGESFTDDDLIACRQYTRPDVWRGMHVPSVLTSGNHDAINQWRDDDAKSETRKMRPDLWRKYLENGRS